MIFLYLSVPHIHLFLTVLFDAYFEDEMDGEIRTVLKLNPKIAPIKAAIFPLVKKLNEPAQNLYLKLKEKFINIEFDDKGSIGKRYRRQDEIGTPICVTFDFESLENQTVTIRNRDTGKQERISVDNVEQYIQNLIS